ncbi:iron-sulfur cluster assembly accessory protein [bacterium AH-315-F03]|nr:iron-sulfur cluster assembly accessory protein [bacterium AH-315-F03]
MESTTQNTNTDTAAPAAESLVNLTPAAIKEVKRLMADEGEDTMYLRLGVEAGGCSGLSYAMGLDTQKAAGDREYEFDGVKTLVDARALLYMAGTTLDFSGGMMGGGFKFINPKAQRSCGCGSSFSV